MFRSRALFAVNHKLKFTLIWTQTWNCSKLPIYSQHIFSPGYGFNNKFSSQYYPQSYYLTSYTTNAHKENLNKGLFACGGCERLALARIHPPLGRCSAPPKVANNTETPRYTHIYIATKHSQFQIYGRSFVAILAPISASIKREGNWIYSALGNYIVPARQMN